ncbi:MAG: hypothetical protein A2268_09775 [Candidatus Raymondbacteria bacterium RifOxyA12_full_50_37]|uniref:Peptidase n=1 Tax=Candidatus Raymondbacteria bacterium RIFOXYD12_FULL_49_13 TaxID=1817890 RepID=A0A1F7F1J2_UNCRA|nr:MAG: hypothetical protein A2268_09775 [Candidatus Raymondbacteria bacterium RifOxyA12_full_50_37]OGJ93873.1 MAG: hypothetical protein A2248_06520 [Candidatus Raymondbacteria bacterium RIFOXYA2_FULL_49_16]OGJ98258.1 MAG: hypothetical protein A2453_00645 [Candidatus Raymondbacteria bacterium RIFOXYC2_FULL_50_21]OGJ98422.1 MAG: hypothetical protein A2350_14275 [Candidatus Raymondbacteria bacterium RifOxyB12_full_50_8]OGK00491.1 MAG: hypothetical protein A2519_10820 [Candidatus Raymondbacteria b
MIEEIHRFTRNSPSDFLEIRLEEVSKTYCTFQGQELEEAGHTETSGGCVRACHRGGWGFSSFTLLKDLPRAVDEAVRQAAYTGTGTTRLQPPEPVADRYIHCPEPCPDSVSLDDKIGIASSYNSILLAHPRIVTSRVSYLDRMRHVYYASSFGIRIEQSQFFSGITFSAMARDGMNVQRAYHSTGDHRGFSNVLGLESKAEEIKQRAIDLLGARKIPGGRHAVLLDPKLAGVFAHEAFGHMSEADFIYENPHIANKMKIGVPFGPSFLNIVDRGDLLAECGGYAYDDEGVKSRENYLIREGSLSGHLHSMETASKMGEPLSGNARAISNRFKPIVRMSCTYIEPGDHRFDDLVLRMDDGIYAVGMLGGNTDLEQFTFSAEYAYRVKNGKRCELLRDVILTGNLFETLKNITALGNDVTLFGGMGGCGKEGQSPLPVSDGGPHVLISSVLIG